jgi:uncharacterized membrane protein YgdD (TMEM256/DUF423 family)
LTRGERDGIGKNAALIFLRRSMNAWLLLAAINGFLAVAAGAFGAHALQGTLDAAALQTFETGVRYHMYHALALGLTALAFKERAAARVAAVLFLTGILLFSGSLYALALTGVRALGMVTPFGGVAFLAGWAALGYAALRPKR